ncbi:MAG: hypothetical protein HY002_11330 [Candidatus Rokubacteria bacterium]|nr:hypothetical protein [Candidatus Rokubacteria bacterium]
MRLVNLFPPDTRSSEEKQRIIEAGGEARQREMASRGFRTFGYDYWDNPQATAGGRGYHYDGRYVETARRICEFYHLKPGDGKIRCKDTLPHLLEEVARNDYEAEMLARWDCTHVTRRPPEWWMDLLARQGYGGDVQFKVLIEDLVLPPLEAQLGLVPVVADETTGQAPR